MSRMHSWVWWLGLVGSAAVAVSAGGPAGAVASDASCSGRAYSYAGLQEAGSSFGIQAAVTALTVPAVSAGHVAAWVGVGGVGEGPHGTSEWLQVGLSAFSGGLMSLYYEVALPGRVPVYTELESQVAAGRPHTWPFSSFEPGRTGGVCGQTDAHGARRCTSQRVTGAGPRSQPARAGRPAVRCATTTGFGSPR